MDFPFVCSACGEINVVDLNNLETRPIDKISAAKGFTCKCGAWYPLLVTNRLLDDTFAKLKRRKVDRDYQHHFAKALRRVIDIRERAGM
jgi:hypothetical protein